MLCIGKISVLKKVEETGKFSGHDDEVISEYEVSFWYLCICVIVVDGHVQKTAHEVEIGKSKKNVLYNCFTISLN